METPATSFSELDKLDAWEAKIISEARKRLAPFTPLSTDVFISTSPKSGTTWTQQICHGLRSGGDMSFDEIDLAIPFLEVAHVYGVDINSPQGHTPRMFKTHLWYPDCPKGAGKYIVVVRRPTDLVVSLYHFCKKWFFDNGETTLESFIEWKCQTMTSPDHSKEQSYLHHISTSEMDPSKLASLVVSWYPYRLDKNVLWLHYEDLKENLRECVRMIADFLDIGSGNDDLQELVTHQASLEFMQAHKSKFDDHAFSSALDEKLKTLVKTMPADFVAKVNVGESGRGKKILSDNAMALHDACWKMVVTKETGHVDYDAFRAAVNKELNRSFLQL